MVVFLGIPLAAGYLSRRWSKARGRSWYETRFLPNVGPWALYGLLFTIVVLFALQGHQITSRPWDVVRIAIPLLAYFAIMWASGYSLGFLLRLGYARTTTLAFTAAGNNFELAIAVAIATYGAASGQALAGVVRPLIEVPVLVGLVAGGVRVDLESAVYRADRRVPARGERRARPAARAERPSIYGDDALGWAFARAGRCDEAVTWSQRSLRLGTQDALLWFHRGYAAGCPATAPG